jgi:hypothetical protein
LVRKLHHCSGKARHWAGKFGFDAEQRHHDYQASVARRDEAVANLENFEREVRSSFDEYHWYGSSGDRPSARTAEHETLQQAVAAAVWEANLTSAAATGLEVATAHGVIKALQAKMPTLQHACLLEAAQPIVGRLLACAQAVTP